MVTLPKVLTVAGSDSGGGAGVQADLKTFEALGCFGMSALTVLTAQNSYNVESVFSIEPKFVGAQIETVLDDFGADAIKIGALYSESIVSSVFRVLKKYKIKIILDPVVFTKSGCRLLTDGAIGALHQYLPQVDLMTPNIPEAELLTGERIQDVLGMEKAAKKLLKRCSHIVLKGGHLLGENSPDLYVTKDRSIWLSSARIKTNNTHGTGCTFSAAIAAYIAKGFNCFDAVKSAKAFTFGAIENGAKLKMGKGHGPLYHSWEKIKCGSSYLH